LLAVRGDRVLGIVDPEVAPYLGWEEFLRALSDIEEQVRKLLEKKKGE